MKTVTFLYKPILSGFVQYTVDKNTLDSWLACRGIKLDQIIIVKE